MEYSLPHAVLALLQEENSPNCPKSYFISSSTKSTKITLIYTRRKREAGGKNKKTYPLNNDRYSSSGTDDYSLRTQSAQNRNYDGMQNMGHNLRICASTPGRGYNDASRVRESSTNSGTAKMATDPLKRSPSKDYLSFNHFIVDNTERHGFDSEISNHYLEISPQEGRPTLGRELDSPNSPRPPTPNFNSYSNALANADILFPGSVQYTPSRQPTIEYDDSDLSPPPTPCISRTKEAGSNSKHARLPNQTETHYHASNGGHFQPIRVYSPHSETPAKLRKGKESYNKPSYQRNQSWDGGKRH